MRYPISAGPIQISRSRGKKAGERPPRNTDFLREIVLYGVFTGLNY